MKTTRIGQLVIDTADALARAQDADSHWWATMGIARRLGAEAVNIGGFNTAPRQVNWVRSSKDPLWLEQYSQEGFATVDPLVRGALSRDVPLLVDIAREERRAPASGKLRDWRAASLGYGYNFLISYGCYSGEQGAGITLSCRDDPTSLFGAGTLRAFSAVSAMMANTLIESKDDIHEGWAYGAECERLSPSERDVLAFIANGLTGHMIADLLNVTEFEIWRRIRNACLKMQAKTVEQALAKAISSGLVEP
ncbi:Response regulator [Marinovum algicola DG 898]|nr:Response regulator [Marinovum algicola DG 898]